MAKYRMFSAAAKLSKSDRKFYEEVVAVAETETRKAG